MAPKEATPAAVAVIQQLYPTAIHEEAFVQALVDHLKTLGFTGDNSIAIVNACRDEVCRFLTTLIDNAFGASFNFAGLGCLINAGKTGLKAAMSHSPETKDADGKLREKYVFFAFPHIAVSETGSIGDLVRVGRDKISQACGALVAITGIAARGETLPEDPEDDELVKLTSKLLAHPVIKESGLGGPSLVDITNAALQIITSDLENLISKVVDPAKSDYAVIVGMQIHSGAQEEGKPFAQERVVDYVAPTLMRAVVNGERYVLKLADGKVTSVKETSLVEKALAAVTV